MKSSSIDRIMVGPNNPHNNNTLWVDTSDGEKNAVLKYKGNPLVGGGNASPSNATESDTNKVWQVTPVLKGTKTEETVIVPEQTLVEHQELDYNDKFVPGAQCVAVIDGVEYRGEVVEFKGKYIFQPEFGVFVYNPLSETFQFINNTESPEVTAKLSVIEETPIYDYNWVPGVKIPVPTAEDEGKILVVTKTESNSSIIVPEQQVPADDATPLTDVDLTKFVVGNTVKVTLTYEGEQGGEDSGGGKKGAKSANSQTLTATGVIEEDRMTGVGFYIQELDGDFSIVNIENSLRTTAFDLGLPNPTIKLEYLELNYEYQLQENSGSNNGTFVIECEYYEDSSYKYWVLPYTESVTLLTDFKESGASLVELRLIDNDDISSRFSFRTNTSRIDYWKFLGNSDQIESLSNKTISGTDTIVLKVGTLGGR